jgi:eukaryotic-like serine/threonine-protein kinase
VVRVDWGRMAQAAAVDSAAHEVLAGRYQLLGLVGVGGMGSVYRARDRALDEIVALKMIANALVLEPEALARFRQEVKLARRVTHHNVARTFDIGEHDGKRFLTMEFVEGESLAALIAREGPLLLGRIADIAQGICAGLAAAHAAGVVHRDLKPENVLIAKTGRVVLTDFGIAREGSTKLTLGGAVGTPAYMAPEQVEGRAVDARADLYALGAILYEMMTGSLAWPGDSPFVVAAARLTQPPPDPRAKRADLPTAAAELVLRCMACAKDARPKGAEEVASVLAGLTLPAAEAPRQGPAVVRSSERRVEGDRRAKLAVLPFVNLGPPDDEYLADGLTEDLIDALSTAKELRVRSRGAVMATKGRTEDPRVLGRELGVDAVAEGSLERAGERLRIRMRLASVQDGFQLWASRFECAVSEFVSVGCDEAARAIVSALSTHGVTGAPRAGIANPAALDLYMRARHVYHKRWGTALFESVQLFREALLHAPSDPAILSGLALALAMVYSRGTEASESYREQAILAARRALEVAPDRAEPRVALGEVLWESADAAAGALEAARALAAAPELADANALVGHFYLDCASFDRAIPRLAAALELDPAQRGARYSMARAHALLGDWDLSDAWLGPPPPNDGHEVSSYWMQRIRLLIWRKDAEVARECLAIVDRTPDYEAKWVTLRGLELIATGKRGEALLRRVRDRAEQSASPRGRSFFRCQEAEGLAAVGDFAPALDALEEADRYGLTDLALLERCPVFGPIRQDPRFRAVSANVEARTRAILAALTGPASPE